MTPSDRAGVPVFRGPEVAPEPSPPDPEPRIVAVPFPAPRSTVRTIRETYWLPTGHYRRPAPGFGMRLLLRDGPWPGAELRLSYGDVLPPTHPHWPPRRRHRGRPARGKLLPGAR